MAKKDRHEHDEVPGDDEGTDASASAPGSDAAEGPATGDGSETGGDELTVDDILGTEQTPDAATAETRAVDESALLGDLKRLQAEYANYRRRTEENRQVESDRARGSVVKGLLPVLDDLDRAEKHGDLAAGSAFSPIAEKLRALVERMGVTTYGAAGEPFDPQHHEAVLQQPTPGVEQPTILEVVETGYRLGDVELRPAKVVVAVPADPSSADEA